MMLNQLDIMLIDLCLSLSNFLLTFLILHFLLTNFKNNLSTSQNPSDANIIYLSLYLTLCV